MASIDERVVKMTFDNAKFEAGVAKTMATLSKLNKTIQSLGTTNGLASIQKAANQVDLSGLSGNIDKLKANLASVGGTTSFSEVEGAANKVTFGPFTTAIEGIKSRLSTLTHAPSAALDLFKEKLGFKGAEAGLNNIEAASNKVKFTGASTAADGLQKKLAFPGIETRFADIEKSSGKVTFSGILNAIGEVSKGFSVLQGAAAVAFGNIISKAALAGGAMVKDLSLGPVITGYKEYELKLNSIQTILANTQASGATLKDVTNTLSELNQYADKTIYNFGQMTKNIGTFTAAGVDLDTAAASIKGIANLAALSGTNAEDAARAMYQLSQAISSGRVSLMDWKSVENAGMGGAVFQRNLAETAVAMGVLDESAVKLTGKMKNVTINGESFRNSIMAKPGEESWLSSKVLTTSLSTFTGDLKTAELAALGFSDAQIMAIQKQAKTAVDAATKVKTFGQLIDTTKESIGSGWAETWEIVFGDFAEAKVLWSSVAKVIGDVTQTSANARNEMLKDWDKLGGRKILIEGVKDAFQALGAVFKPIKEAFREIFPEKTGKDLLEMTKNFANFTEKLKIGPETAENLKRTFAGFFAVLDIGKTIVGEIIGVFVDMLGAATSGSGGFLKFTANIGDFLVAVRNAIKEGEGLSNFFDGLGKVLSAPIKLLSDLAGALGNLFGGEEDSSGLASSVDSMEKSLNPLTIALDAAAKAWEGFLDILKEAGKFLGPVVQEIGKLFGTVGEEIANAFVDADFEAVFDVIQTTLIGGIFLAIKKGFSKGVNIDLGGGALGSLSESFKVLTGSLKAMQKNIQADTLLKIGLAVTALAAGVAIFAKIDPKRLTIAMTAVAVGLGQLVGAVALLTKGATWYSFVYMPFIASSLILLAVAIDTLSLAVVIFAKLSWEELARGLAGVGGALAAIALGIKLMPTSIMLIGPALLPIAVALNIIAVAVKIFSTMSWEELAKGLLGISVALRAIAVATLMFPPGMVGMGVGLIAIAVALNILAAAVLLFGSMDMKTMGKGLLGIGAALVVVGLAISKFPPNVMLQAAALVLLSIALTGMAGAIALMGNLSIVTIAKGLTAIGLSLVVLGRGLTKMSGTLLGSAALFVAASALAILAPVLGILGTMKWGTITKGLLTMSLVLATLAIAGATASAPITALGYALLVLASSVAVAGAGIYLLASGLAKLGGEGSKGIAAVMIALTAFLALLPKMIIDFIKGLVEIGEAIAKLAPQVVESMVTIIELMLDVIIKSAPKMAVAAVVLISAFLKVLRESVPEMIATGFHLLISLLKGIADNIGEVVKQVGTIVVTFLTSILSWIPQIIIAGANVLIKFLEGITSKMPGMIAAAANAVAKFITGIAENLPQILTAGINLVVEFIKGIAKDIGKVIEAGGNLIVKILEGIGKKVDDVAAAGADMMGDFVDAAAKAILKLTERVAQIMINFLTALSVSIDNNAEPLGRAGGKVAASIISGIIKGIGAGAAEVGKKLAGLAGEAISGFMDKIRGKSPSKVFIDIGGYITQGLIIGINNGTPDVVQTIRSTADGMINTMNEALADIPNILDGLMDVNPVITPILDLSNVQKNAAKLSELTNVTPITAAASYGQAASISVAQEAAQATISETATQKSTEFKFEQNNYSPKALSPAEIYRHTRNQLSQAKSVLGLVS